MKKEKNVSEITPREIGAVCDIIDFPEDYRDETDFCAEVPGEGRDDFCEDLESFIKYLSSKRPGHGLGLLEMLSMMGKCSQEERKYGFDFFDLSSRDRVKIMFKKFWEPRYCGQKYYCYKLGDFLDDDLDRLDECFSIFAEPACGSTLTQEEIERMIEDVIDNSELIIRYDCSKMKEWGIAEDKIAVFREGAEENLRQLLRSAAAESSIVAVA